MQPMKKILTENCLKTPSSIFTDETRKKQFFHFKSQRNDIKFRVRKQKNMKREDERKRDEEKFKISCGKRQKKFSSID